MSKKSNENLIIAIILGVITLVVWLVKVIVELISKGIEKKGSKESIKKDDYNYSGVKKVIAHQNDEYAESRLFSLIFQYFETLYIVCNTPNINTLENRLEFLDQKIIDIRVESLNVKTERLGSVMASVVEKYQSMYYDRGFTDYEHRVYLMERENLYEFYGNCIAECFYKFNDKETDAIANLKTEKGKENRFNKIKITANKYTQLIERFCLNEDAKKHNIEVISNCLK